MKALPRLGLYLLTVVILFIALSFKLIIEVERFSTQERVVTMAIFGFFSLTSFFTGRGLAKKRTWSWYSAMIYYIIITAFFLFLHFNSISSLSNHPYNQGYSLGAGGIPIFFKYFYLFLTTFTLVMLVILYINRREYLKGGLDTLRFNNSSTEQK